MRYLTFGTQESNEYPVALLTRYLGARDLREYVKGIEEDVVAYTISYPSKAKNDEILKYLDALLPVLSQLKTDYIVVTEASLFKVLTKEKQVSKLGGYILPCRVKGFEHFNITYVPAPGQVIRNPPLMEKVNQGLRSIRSHRNGVYLPPGSDIIRTAHYLHEPEEISVWLEKLLDVPLAMDIEAFSLKHYDAGIGTFAMAWNQHEGIAFCVDLYQSPKNAAAIRVLLASWFRRRTAKTLWHNASYDVYVLIYQLFMKGLLDNEGILDGLEIFFKDIEDTQIISYLATNSCSGNNLSLKDQAQEFAGDYAQDVKDIRQIPKDILLVYNLVDALSTWYVYNKHWEAVVADGQESVYRDIFLPSMKDIIQMQLTGLPLDMDEVIKGRDEMQAFSDMHVKTIMESKPVKVAEELFKIAYVEKRNSEWKVKRITVDDVGDIDDVKLNLNSPLKLQRLLYEVMELPVLETTDTGQPATGGEVIANLVNHTQDPEYKKVLEALVEFKAVDKILTAFIPAFQRAVLAEDGHYYLFGSFMLGGAISGRMSSSSPNMQNMPASRSKYAETIKKMVRTAKGWLFCGLDFSSLEDRISALTTKDPNKLLVYTQGYDGHCLRAFAYFGDLMAGIDPESVDSINSIDELYPMLRQDSKTPTFALTYAGTWRTLVAKMGWSPEKAKAVEAAYHTLYAVSDKWVADKLKEAAKAGYVTLAFGLRLRTPMLQQTVAGTKSTPYEATAEGRSAGNALGQSWGLLNNRAASEFMAKVRASKFRHDIRPAVHIHDAQYYLIRNDADTIAWVNEHLVSAVQWQDHPDIAHDEVKLGGELSVFYPSWADELTIPNGADASTILQLAKAHISK